MVNWKLVISLLFIGICFVACLAMAPKIGRSHLARVDQGSKSISVEDGELK